MGSIYADSVSFAYDGGEPIIREATLHLTDGWAGLVGANGAGKTTLLRLLAGEVVPDAGHCLVKPTGATVVLCPQRVDDLDDAIEAFAEDEGGVAARLRGTLALADRPIERWPSLSPGERKRWQIGAALCREPTVLLLDEPTNHIDSGTRNVLREALRRFRGLGVLVSHDRELLDTITTRTFWLSEGRVDTYEAPYGRARGIRTADSQRANHERAEAKVRITRARKTLEHTRRRHESAQRAMSGRGRDAKDRDARSAGAKARRALAEARLGREVSRRRSATERALARLPASPAVQSEAASMFVDFVPASKRRLLSLQSTEVVAGTKTLLRDVSVHLDRHDRVRLDGPNGAGKTTLLSCLLSASRLDPARVFHLPQDTDVEGGAALVRVVRQMDAATRGRVLALMARMGSDPGRIMTTDRPSPGETRKLQIAIGLGRLVWAVVLDEPTNHLDLPSVDRMKEALSDYPGALLLVSHDSAFADGLTSARWRIAEGHLEVESPG